MVKNAISHSYRLPPIRQYQVKINDKLVHIVDSHPWLIKLHLLKNKTVVIQSKSVFFSGTPGMPSNQVLQLAKDGIFAHLGMDHVHLSLISKIVFQFC